MGLSDRTPPTAEEYAAYRERFCNWGRWGDDDELGTLNHITPEARRSAATLVQTGQAVSMSRPIDTHAGPANPYPAHHFVGAGDSGAMADYFGMFIHGFVQTHIDALCHLPVDGGGKFWNGKEFAKSPMPAEHTGTIDFWSDGIVTRGVLYDVPRFRGTDYVAPGEPVHGWELADVAAAQGIEPRAGDAVCIRSGMDVYFEKTDMSQGMGSNAGVHASAIEFLYETEASCLTWDFQDAPQEDQGIPNPMPISIALHVHHILLPYMGMPIIDNADFEAVAARCADLDRWEFQYVCAPLVLRYGTGSPVNPLAIL